MQFVTVLGSTGSIGKSTLQVIALQPERYRVYALTANRQVDLLLQQIQRFAPVYAVMRDVAAAAELREKVAALGLATEVLEGEAGLVAVASATEVDQVMAAIVGAAGLSPSIAAAAAGKTVLLANKEALVMAGDLFLAKLQQGGGTLLPIDSEHNAIFQCLPAGYKSAAAEGVRKILLTASGGPFRCRSLDELVDVTPDEACAHPNWSMGRKISVDSASMMNKGLELIEACYLFSVPHTQIDVVIHPQSVIHSMVEYLDGSVLAQMGNPDMRTPIAHAMAWPQRIESGVGSLDLIAQARLDFEAPDEQRFPCLRLAREAIAAGGSVVAALNAANEIAVEAFLQERLRFIDIPRVIEGVLNAHQRTEPDSLEAVQQVDADARRVARTMLPQ